MKHFAAKSLLSVMLSLMMLVVFTPVIAFADDVEAVDETQPAVESEFVDEVVDEVIDFDEALPADKSEYDFELTELPDGLFGFDQLSRVRDAVSQNTGDVKAGDVFVVNSIKTYMDLENATQSSVIFYRTTTPINSYYYAVSDPIEITKGIVAFQNIGFLAGSGDTPNGAKFAIFYDSACKKPVDGYVTYSADNNQFFFKIPKTGKYYIAVGASDADWGTAQFVGVRFLANRYAQAKTGTTLKNQFYAVRCGKGKTVTVKYKPASTGLLDVYAYDKTKTTLKKNSGKSLGSQTTESSRPATFGVKAKTKYKISIKDSKQSTQRGYVLAAETYKVANQSGSSKKKAKVLNQGEYKFGVIIAGSKKSKWFKFKNDQTAPFAISFMAGTNSKFKFEFYKGKSKIKNWTTYLTPNKTGYELDALENMPVGTYYVKVTPIKKSSGVFGVGWNR